MTTHFASWKPETLDLAIRRFTIGLDEPETSTLERQTRSDDLFEFENAVTAVHLSSLERLEQPSAEFLRKLEREGRQQVAELAAARAETATPRPTAAPSAWSRPLTYSGWLAAAAALLLYLLPVGGADLFKRREALLEAGADIHQVAWSQTEDPAAARASGDVVWSPAKQEGYMRFSGLEPNDPSRNQYQLWIFDAARADWEAKPVDGGVFDVASDGEVIVPIDPKLEIREDVLFAVTLEVSGGVVVSERERLVLTAAL